MPAAPADAACGRQASHKQAHGELIADQKQKRSPVKKG